MSSTIANNVVMEGAFERLTLIDGTTRPGPWGSACLSAHTGPVWVYVDTEGNVVPLSATLIAWRSGTGEG